MPDEEQAFVIVKEGWTKERYDKWFATLETKDTPTSARFWLFEIKYTGDKNFLLPGSGGDFWADGISNQTILEAKFILDSARSRILLILIFQMMLECM
jgi:hypothetical protein